MTDMPCPNCGKDAAYCQMTTSLHALVSPNPAPARCCAACSGNHSGDTYDRYYPPNTATKETNQ